MDDIARARLDAEDKLHLKAADTLHRELLQELDRYRKTIPSLLSGSKAHQSFSFSPLRRFPLVERAVADVPALADPEFAAGIRKHAQELLQRSRGVPGVFLSLFFFTTGDDNDGGVLFFLKVRRIIMSRGRIPMRGRGMSVSGGMGMGLLCMRRRHRAIEKMKTSSALLCFGRGDGVQRAQTYHIFSLPRSHRGLNHFCVVVTYLFTSVVYMYV